MKPSVQRIFSMSAFEALRNLHKYRSAHPNLSEDELIRLVSKLEVGALDYEAAQILDELVPESANHRDPISFFRVCIEAALSQNDIWVRSITLGRKKFIQKLDRDEASCFRCAQLLDDPPSRETVAWWDRLQSTGRKASELETMERARDAERLSLRLESMRLPKLGIKKAPVWMSVEDNTVGYDILSFDLGEVGPIAKLIEVKSFFGQRRFYISRNEWNTAIKFGSSYVFHIWDMQATTVYEKTVQQIHSQIPSDGQDGRWSEAIIRLT